MKLDSDVAARARNTTKQTLVYMALGVIPVIWLGLLVAPALAGERLELLQNLTAALNYPFNIIWVEDSLKTVLFFIAAYGMAIGIYLSTKRNKRPREEHGYSAC